VGRAGQNKCGSGGERTPPPKEPSSPLNGGDWSK
jgi:hypothetical protein